MPYDDILLDAEERMQKAVDVLLEEFKGVRTGRATPALVENIRVEYYGAPTPLRQLASITIPDPRLIMIKPFDSTSLNQIEKAILKADIGLNPQNDGKLIRLAVPPLSEERRKKMAEVAKDICERAKVSIRNIRRDAIRRSEDEEDQKIISEDEKFRIKDGLQELIDKYQERIEELTNKKIKEIMEV
jgi:ribosome recycling factor